MGTSREPQVEFPPTVEGAHAYALWWTRALLDLAETTDGVHRGLPGFARGALAQLDGAGKLLDPPSR